MKKHNKSKIRDSSFFLREIWINQEISNLETSNDQNNIKGLNYRQVEESLDKYYFIMKLTIHSHERNRLKLIPHSSHFIEESNFLDYWNKRYMEKEPSINAWYYALRLLNCQQDEKRREIYDYLKKVIQENHEIMNDYDIRNICGFLQNNVSKIKKGISYYEELFDLYRLQFEHYDLEKDLSRVTSVFLRNIINVALKLGKYDWARNFLKKYEQFIGNKDQNLLHFLNGLIEFELNNFEGALESISQVSFINLHLNILERIFRTKIYYELNYEVLLENELNSLSVFLSRRQIELSKKHLMIFRNFSNTMSALIKIPTFDLDKKEKLREQILNEQNLTEVEWLISKLE